jgi:hypothetical protein
MSSVIFPTLHSLTSDIFFFFFALQILFITTHNAIFHGIIAFPFFGITLNLLINHFLKVAWSSYLGFWWRVPLQLACLTLSLAEGCYVTSKLSLKKRTVLPGFSFEDTCSGESHLPCWRHPVYMGRPNGNTCSTQTLGMWVNGLFSWFQLSFLPAETPDTEAETFPLSVPCPEPQTTKPGNRTSGSLLYYILESFII